jgi:hypothetical protein
LVNSVFCRPVDVCVHASLRDGSGGKERKIVGRILVTGATGSLGSNVIAEAARRGVEVRALTANHASSASPQD